MCDYLAKITDTDLLKYAAYQCVAGCDDDQVFY